MYTCIIRIHIHTHTHTYTCIYYVYKSVWVCWRGKGGGGTCQSPLASEVQMEDEKSGYPDGAMRCQGKEEDMEEMRE